MNNKNYTTESKIQEYLNQSVTQGDADQFILATQRYIDQYTDRNFLADKTASTRLYDGNDRNQLVIDDCVDVTKVEVGNDAWGDTFSEVDEGVSSGYYLRPTNYSQEGLPIRKVLLRSRIWIKGIANHRITAKWGYSEDVPADISFVATVLASGMYYQNRGENTGAIKSEKIGEYAVSYADNQGFSDLKTAMSILDSYKKYHI